MTEKTEKAPKEELAEKKGQVTSEEKKPKTTSKAKTAKITANTSSKSEVKETKAAAPKKRQLLKLLKLPIRKRLCLPAHGKKQKKLPPERKSQPQRRK